MKKIKAGIIGKVCIRPFKDYRFSTCFDLYFYVNDKKLFVPAGFKTDLASIPRIFWSIVAPYNAHLIAPAIIHDWLYSQKTEFNRKEADIIFYTLLIKNGMSRFLSSIMYYCVRIFGKSHFKE
jgi:hypothetical protein